MGSLYKSSLILACIFHTKDYESAGALHQHIKFNNKVRFSGGYCRKSGIAYALGCNAIEEKGRTAAAKYTR